MICLSTSVINFMTHGIKYHPSLSIVHLQTHLLRIELVSLSQTRVAQELPVPLVHENFFPLEGKRQKLDVKFQVKIILFQTFLLLSYEQKERK